MLERHVTNLIQAISRDGSTADLGDLFLRMTADVTTDFMFGESVQLLAHPESFEANWTTAFQDAKLGCEFRARLGQFADFVPQPKFSDAVKKVHAYMDAHVDKALQYRKSLDADHVQQSGPTHADTKKRYVFLHELSKLTDDRQTLRNELLTIFFGGRDTTSALLTNMFFLLARHPRVWKKLRNEVCKLDGMESTVEDLKAMEYLGFCLNEALRLYPVIPGNSRIPTKDTVLPVGGGLDGKSPVFVPAGTLVVYHVYALHRREDLWGPDAAEFRPERWKTEKGAWKYLPFNSGPRKCIGQQFALTEAQYRTVRLLQEFVLIENRDAEPWRESLAATCTSANGAKVAMKTE
ncbi:hypothetical protein MMC25_006178 [Agyrium rufum]|nr:hypothetical protein [Agyrium rufum]